MRCLGLAAAVAALFVCGTAAAEQQPSIGNTAMPLAYWDGTGQRIIVDPSHPLPVTGGGVSGNTNDAGDLPTTTTDQRTVALNYGFEPSSSQWFRVYVDPATHALLERTVGPSMQPPGTASTIARAVQRPDGKNMLAASELPSSYPDATADAYLGTKGDAASPTGTLSAQMQQLHIDAVGPSFGTYNSTSPTLANGSVGSLQLDASGQLKAVVNPAAGSTWPTVDSNLVQTINAAGSTTTKAVSTQRADGKALLTAGDRVMTATEAAPGTNATSANAVQGVSGGLGVPSAATAAANGLNVSTGVVRVPSSGANQVLTAVKASAGRVYKITGFNAAAGPRRIKFYNVAAASVTPGTTVPVLVKYLPSGAAFSYDMADIGWYFSTAISFSISQTSADSDTSGVAAGDITDLSVEFQ